MNNLLNQIGLQNDACRGKVVVVSGAGGGIGLQVARAFALLEAQVVLAEISDQGQAAAEGLRAQGGQAVFIRTDVSNEANVASLAARVHSLIGKPDILVNNAIKISSAAVNELSIAEWDQVIAVNLRGTFLMTKAFLPDMLERKAGVIINMVSTDAMPGLSAYIASKQGILGFSQSLALEVGEQGVSVIPYAPGMVDTPGIRSVSADLAPRLGLSEAQFLSLSLSAAYEGLMPAEHAGVGTAYLALRLAQEQHGQLTNGYEVLERAGLIGGGMGLPGERAKLAPALSPPPAVPSPDLGARLAQVRLVLQETEAEFNRFPVFVRPLARNGFKNKAGLTPANWQRALDELERRLAPDRPGLSAQEVSAWQAQFEKLARYYRAAPADAAKITRDQDFLAEAGRLAQERTAIVETASKELAG
jgi:NAD(P)-dependent dehydrogenase (short-subunit alcohol dehydrogenase family)